ncbi:MAG: SDR family oxidoreductase [Micrococcales bacterium]|nr:SDR family oxidoreductase [Micrococcales bacterium]
MTVRRCYVCRGPVSQVYAQYPMLCGQCAVANLAHRDQQVDLAGYTALVTGARTKIGYHTAVRLLRNGATVLATSRFPRSAWAAYAAEADVGDWAHRLHLFGLDLLRVDRLDVFVEQVYQTIPALDVLVNNAAQTVVDDGATERWYAAEADLSRRALTAAPTPFEAAELPGPVRPAGLEVMAPTVPGELVVGASLTLSSNGRNAWTKHSTQVDVRELLETQLINVTAPYLLATTLKPLLEASEHPNRFVINVSSLEGKFSITKKSPKHPHTNMGKAALNMMTKTLAGEYRKSGIFVYSVDPGWVSDQFPDDHRAPRRELPLDMVDAAARITHPVFEWRDAERPPGIFLKDYAPTDW